jgi:hypothetical protein
LLVKITFTQHPMLNIAEFDQVTPIFLESCECKDQFQRLFSSDFEVVNRH